VPFKTNLLYKVRPLVSEANLLASVTLLCNNIYLCLGIIRTYNHDFKTRSKWLVDNLISSLHIKKAAGNATIIRELSNDSTAAQYRRVDLSG
jgi:hypothetical protein